jgi:hypothetical protein
MIICVHTRKPCSFSLLEIFTVPPFQIFKLDDTDFEALDKVHQESGKLQHLLNYGEPGGIMASGKVFGWSLKDMGWEEMD